MKYAIVATVAVFILTACTTTDEIIIDQKGRQHECLSAGSD